MRANLAHFVIDADDVAAARTFYERVFGWTITPWVPPGSCDIRTGTADASGIGGSAAVAGRGSAHDRGRVHLRRRGDRRGGAGGRSVGFGPVRVLGWHTGFDVRRLVNRADLSLDLRAP